MIRRELFFLTLLVEKEKEKHGSRNRTWLTRGKDKYVNIFATHLITKMPLNILITISTNVLLFLIKTMFAYTHTTAYQLSKAHFNKTKYKHSLNQINKIVFESSISEMISEDINPSTWVSSVHSHNLHQHQQHSCFYTSRIANLYKPLSSCLVHAFFPAFG